MIPTMRRKNAFQASGLVDARHGYQSPLASQPSRMIALPRPSSTISCASVRKYWSYAPLAPSTSLPAEAWLSIGMLTTTRRPSFALTHADQGSMSQSE